jgi:AAA domain
MAYTSIKENKMANLDARLEAQKLRELYMRDPNQNTFKMLLTGESGSGKTYILSTCRKPIFIDSFDPGGAKCLRELIMSGDVIVDARYERENPMKPSAFGEWRRAFEERERSNFFASFGTYCLDSSTTWAEAIMNDVLDKAKRAGESPRFTHDYVPQKTVINNYMHRILALPCDVIVTGHLQPMYESKFIGGEEQQILTGWRYLTTGKGTVTIPLLFDELYVTVTKESSRGIDYQLLTARTGLYLAKTRIGVNRFDTYEKPDIKALLRKAGLPANDKPRLGEVDKDTSDEISAESVSA